MLHEAISKVEKRHPASANMFEGLSFVNHKDILSQTLRGKFEDIPFPYLIENDSVVEAQCRKVYLVESCEEKCYITGGRIPADSLNFCHDVYNHNNFKILLDML